MLQTWQDSVAPRARLSGRKLFEEKHVTAVQAVADHLVTATVQDERALALTLFYTRGEWSSRCACDVGVACDHAYAAALAWIAAVQAGVPDGRDPGAIPAAGATRPEPLDRPEPPALTPEEQAAEAELAVWLRALPEADEPEPSNPLRRLGGWAGLRVRFDAGGRWWVEMRPAADQPWKSPTQRWLNDLAQLRPADLDGVPAAEAALAIALAAEHRLAPPGLAARRPLADAAVSALLRTPAARPALVRPDGEPLVIEAEPLTWEAVAAADEPERLDLRLVAPDGRVAETAVLIARAPVPLYLFDGYVRRGPPPVPAARLPAAALTDGRLRPRLHAAGLRLPEGQAAELRRVTLRPRLKCWLSPAFEGQERDFHAQLVAGAEQPPCEQQWAGAPGVWRWTSTGAPPPRAAGEPVLEFDLSRARAASARFGGFRLIWDGWAEAWTRPVTDAFPEEFLAWHAELAAVLDGGVDVSPELASLLGAPLRAQLTWSVGAAPASDQDWFDLTVGLKVQDATLSPEEVALLLKARGKWVHLPRHGWRRVETRAEVDGETAALLDRLGVAAEDVVAGGRPTRHRLHALQLALETEALADRDALLAHALKDRATRLRARPPASLPPGLQATLRPYQVEGYQFLAHLSAQGLGGILADDMGLGKTVQTLAWLLHLAAARENGPAGGAGEAASTPPEAFRALVVCPKSVMHGWLTETARFAPGLPITAFASEARPRAAGGLGAPGVVVANYSQLRRHAAAFRAVAWDAVVLDEGQFIKNPGSQVAVAARSLRARRRLVLTGTPIENRLADLWSLFAFAQPGLLGDQAAFRRHYNEADPESLGRLHRRVRHFLLRRTKAQAAPDLPPRTEDEIVVELEPGQRRLYDAELKRARAELLGVETARELDAVRFHVLASLLRLRQICCHPGLVDPAHATLPSAKLEALLERIEELAEEGHQVLVFSQFVEMLHLIRDRLTAAGIGHLMLTGATENRAALVDEFQSDPTKTVFLLSLRAAGFGLNLTAASYAILYDPWWNPAAEAQAIDRIHRIGQTKPVIAYRLLAAETVEEKIRLLQREKAALAAAVVQEESLRTVLDLDSLRRILG